MWQHVLLGSLTLLLSAQAPFPNKISCFVSTCVSSDNSFPIVRQEPSFGLWKGSPFLQQKDYIFYVLSIYAELSGGVLLKGQQWQKRTEKCTESFNCNSVEVNFT